MDGFWSGVLITSACLYNNAVSHDLYNVVTAPGEEAELKRSQGKQKHVTKVMNKEQGRHYKSL